MDYQLIEQLLNLPRIRISGIVPQQNDILIWVSIPDDQHVWPKCGLVPTNVSEINKMKVSDLSIFGQTCWLIIEKGCLHSPCSFRRDDAIDFVDQCQRLTSCFAEFLFQLGDRVIILAASELLQVSWKRAPITDQNALNHLKRTAPCPRSQQ